MNESPAVPALDVERLAGSWHLQAHIPAKFDRQACNAVVSLVPRDDGSIQINYRFAAGTPDGPRKLFRGRAYAGDQANPTEWRVQPFWPFAWPVTWPCVVDYFDAEYSSIVIGHPKRKYVWIMTNTAEIPEQAYLDLVALAEGLGYDPSRIRRVPRQ